MSHRKVFSLIKGGSSAVGSHESLGGRRLALCSSPEARDCISYDLAQRHVILPLGLVSLPGRKRLTVAVPTGKKAELQQAAVFMTGHEVCAVEMDLALVIDAIFVAYRGDDNHLRHSIEQLRSAERPLSPPAGTNISFRPEQGDVGIFLADLVEYALAQEASDIHLVPLSDGLYIRLRIRGELRSHQEPACSSQRAGQIASRIKVLSSLDISVHDRPMDGAFSLPVSSGSAFVRVNIMPTIHGEKVVLRLVRSALQRSLDQIGYSDELRSHLNEVVRFPSGLVALSGPTGSGKTTTLYGLAGELIAHGLNVVSLEDPVEAVVKGMSQTSISSGKKFGFAEGLRSILRQDPDVILVGEIRDREVAELTLQAALAGRLVLTSVHAGSAVEVIMRFGSFGVDMFTLSQALRLVVWQQLLPCLCSACKVIDLTASNASNANIYKAVGCDRCDYSGFQDRVPLAEALRLDSVGRSRLGRCGITSETHEVLKDCVRPQASEERMRLCKEGKIPVPT